MFEVSYISTNSIAGFLRGLKPDPVLTVSEWADQRRILPQTSAEPGKFRTVRTPYAKEIMDKLSVHDPAQTIVVKKGSQLGFTEIGNNWMGYVVDVAPAPFLYVMPTDTMMKDTSQNRIKPMIDTTPALYHKIKQGKAKVSSNKILFKEFENGFIKMVGANSPTGLASTAVRFVYLDECDRYPLNVGGEGSAIALADTRTATYGARKKKFITSTPTIKGQSAIDIEFQKTGQREYYVPCPHCAALQSLCFEQLRYEPGKYDQVLYECIHCNSLISERYKKEMLENGQWIAKFPEKEDGITFGYYISAMYSPPGWYSWGQMAKEYQESAEDLPTRITWMNTKKGEVYEQEGDRPQWEIIYAQRQNYKRGTVKANVAFITAGVDVQADRFELEICGWMKGKQCQSIDYRIIPGDTSLEETWEKLAPLLNEVFTRLDGAQMQIALVAIDTGYNTSMVYEFAIKKSSTGRIVPVKGDDDLGMIFSAPKPMEVSREGRKIGRTKVFRVGVSMLKSELYGWLKLVRKDDGSYPNGYCHFPEYGEEYFRGLTAEKISTTTNNKGYTVIQWIKFYKRNEPLDCRIYARAAASIYGMDLFTDAMWEKRMMFSGVTSKPKQEKAKKNRDSFWT